MKRKLLITIGLILSILIICLLIYSGRKRTDVYLKDFKLSENNQTMTLEVGVSSSSGYIRKMKKTSGSMNYYYTFYQTFGINSKLGAKDTFEIELDNNVSEIYFYTGKKGYKLVLVKNDITNEWEKVNYQENNTLKLNLFEKEEIIKVAIDTYSQNNNYYEITNKNTIEKIYNIFSKLETNEVNKNYNPDNPEEMYKIIFFNDEFMLAESDNDILKSEINIYRKQGKYYVSQIYNGIYQIKEEEFNLIKSYIK